MHQIVLKIIDKLQEKNMYRYYLEKRSRYSNKKNLVGRYILFKNMFRIFKWKKIELSVLFESLFAMKKNMGLEYFNYILYVDTS